MEHIYRRIKQNYSLLLSIGFIAIAILGVTFISPLKVDAAINNTINFQSKIVNKATGLNISAGSPACVAAGADTCDFRIRVWNLSSGGTTTSGTNLMYEELFTNIEIGDTNGTFNLTINSVCAATTSGTSQWGTTGTSSTLCNLVDDSDSDSDTGVNFNRQDLWLEVTFDPSGAWTTLASPPGGIETFTRTNLKSVPSAFVAQTLGGLDSTGFVQLAPSATQSTSSTNSLINLTYTGSSNTNPLILVNENGSGGPNLLDLQVGGTSRFTVGNVGNLVINQAAAATGTPNVMILNGAAHTALTASTEDIDINFNLARTVQFSTGALTTQRAFVVQAPTYGFVGASTLTNASTMAITGAPVAGTNATITNSNALLVNTGTATGRGIVIQGAASQTGDLLQAQNSGAASQFAVTGAGNVTMTPSAVTTGNPTIMTVTGPADTGLTASSEKVDINFNLARTVQRATGAVTNQRSVLIQAPTFSFVGASTITNASTVAITGAPVAGTNATITNANALLVNTGVATARGLIVQGAASQSADLVQFQNSGATSLYAISATGNQTISPSAVTTGNPTIMTVTGPADTGLTASSEKIDINFNLARTVQRATGAVTNQRAILIQAPTYSFVGASTITNASTVAITGAPVAGTNATITNQNALLVNTGVAAAKGIVIQAAGSQTGNLLEFQSSTPTLLSYFDSAGKLAIGSTATNGDFLTVGAATTTAASIHITSSAGTNISAPDSGDLWWNGTNLNFRTGSSTIDLLASSGSGFVNFASGSTQTTATANNLIDITTTGTATGTLVVVNENGSGTPNLIDLQVAGTSRFKIDNSGFAAIGGSATITTTKGLVQGQTFATSAVNIGASFSGINTGANAFSITGSESTADVQPGTGNTTGTGTGASGLSKLTTAGTLNNANALYSRVLNSSTGTIAAARGLYADTASNTGGGSITNAYGIYVENQNVGTSAYGIYITGATTASLYVASGLSVFGPATTGASSVRLTSSVGTNPSTPTSGDLWWNGTNLNFRTASTTVDLLASGGGSYVNFATGSTQSSSSTNGLIDIATTGNVASPLVKVNENGAGNPDLLLLQTASTNKLQINNDGAVLFTPTAGTNNPFSVLATFTSASGANQAFSLTPTQTVATTGSVDSFLLTPTANVVSGSVAGMNGVLTRMTTSGGVNLDTARGLTSWGNIGSGTTVNNLYNVSILNADNSGTINNNFGIRIDNQTAGTSDYGIYIEGADTYALWSDSGVNRFDDRTSVGGASATSDSFSVILNATASGGVANLQKNAATLTAAANNDILTGLRITPSYSNGAFTGVVNQGIYVNTGILGGKGVVVQAVASQTGNLYEAQDSSGNVVSAITATGALSAGSTSTTRIQASGATAGNTNNGSIYFLDSSGTTRGRVDTVATSTNNMDGDGADGAVTVTTSKNINTATIATGRVTYADGIAYRVNAPSLGDMAVTRYRSADTVSNGLAAGDDVLLINLQGATVVSASAPSFDTASVGNYEILTVASVSASTVTFTTPIKGRYVGLNVINQRVIIQRVPNYTTVTVNSGGTITASSYEGLTTVPTGGSGYLTGIVAFKATGAVTVNTGGTISVNGLGYRGGTAGAAGANGGFNGESTNAAGANVSGRGGNGASNGETWGGGRASNGAVANPNNGIIRGGGGGGGSNGSAATGADGSGGGGGGGYGGGGGGGGGGAGNAAQNGGVGGTGGSSEVAAGGGGGGATIGASNVGGAGGNAGSAGGNATAGGVGGAVGNGQTTGSGGGGTAATAGGGGGGGGGGLYGDPLLTNMFFGSGGGGGAGGFSVNTAGVAGANGGGIIYIMADSISLPGTGTITANGNAGANGTAPASGGGGGAGGSIRLETNTGLSLGSSLVTATGGAAGTQAARRGASGAGGVGRIYGQYVTTNTGTTNPTATIAQVTNNYGTLYIGAVNTSAADLAEYYVTGDNTIEAGDVVSISPYRVANENNEELATQGVLRKTNIAYDSKLVGVISTQPGVTLGSKDANGQADSRALALKGRVPVKIDPDSEPISIGDYLTSSAKPGYAKKATEPGYTIGKAIEYWNNGLNKDKINVFVDLGYYYGGNSSAQQALALSNSAGLAISNYSMPSNIVNIVSRATDGQVLGTSTTSANTTNSNNSESSNSLNSLENEIKLALGSSEVSDYYSTSDAVITTGDVVKFDENNNLIKTSERGDSNVVGVVATQPNILLNGLIDSENNRTVSMGGKVVLKVTDINGAIKKGDYLAPSSIPGYAQKADNANGLVLGRAIEDFPLAATPDSAMVSRELQKNKQQTLNMIADLVRSGKFLPSDSEKYTNLINQYYQSFTTASVEGNNSGRIMAYVNIGYITEGMMLPRNTNVAQGTIPGSNTNSALSSDMQSLISQLQNTQLTLTNVLTVKNVIEAQTYQNITGLDLAFKISSANNSFRVLDMNNDSLLAVDQNGKLTLKEGQDSSIGEVIFPAQTPEMFIDNKSVTENSKIYLTPSEFVFSKVRAINPGVGFTIQLQNVMEQDIKVDYLIIN